MNDLALVLVWTAWGFGLGFCVARLRDSLREEGCARALHSARRQLERWRKVNDRLAREDLVSRN